MAPRDIFPAACVFWHASVGRWRRGPPCSMPSCVRASPVRASAKSLRSAPPPRCPLPRAAARVGQPLAGLAGTPTTGPSLLARVLPAAAFRSQQVHAQAGSSPGRDTARWSLYPSATHALRLSANCTEYPASAPGLPRATAVGTQGAAGRSVRHTTTPPATSAGGERCTCRAATALQTQQAPGLLPLLMSKPGGIHAARWRSPLLAAASAGPRFAPPGRPPWSPHHVEISVSLANPHYMWYAPRGTWAELLPARPSSGSR